jgi:hypothetical protein
MSGRAMRNEKDTELNDGGDIVASIWLHGRAELQETGRHYSAVVQGGDACILCRKRWMEAWPAK